ncbi:MAG: GFA family protein [Granulosicoccus sp.]|nr:GFA family protein [Granulosicoccus sp.]
MSKLVNGGCFCGAIRYEITGEAEITLFCFCKDCQKITGTDGYAGYMVKNGDFALVKGSPSIHKKTSKEGRIVERHFCGTCGSNLWGVTEFGLTSVSAGTLDDTSVFKPSKKVFVHDAPAWARIPDYLEEM